MRCLPPHPSVDYLHCGNTTSTQTNPNYFSIFHHVRPAPCIRIRLSKNGNNCMRSSQKPDIYASHCIYDIFNTKSWQICSFHFNLVPIFFLWYFDYSFDNCPLSLDRIVCTEFIRLVTRVPFSLSPRQLRARSCPEITCSALLIGRHSD